MPPSRGPIGWSVMHDGQSPGNPWDGEPGPHTGEIPAGNACTTRPFRHTRMILMNSP
jgi:hypothetical protein